MLSCRVHVLLMCYTLTYLWFQTILSYRGTLINHKSFIQLVICNIMFNEGNLSKLMLRLFLFLYYLKVHIF